MVLPASGLTRLRVLLVGCGRVGRVHAKAVAGSPHAELVGLCDLQSKRAELICRDLPESPSMVIATELPEAISRARPDVVLIASPTAHHFKHVRQALEAGCHVFCEKPLSETLAEARTLCRLAQEGQRYVGVDYNRRLGFAYCRAWSWLSEHAIGEIRHVALHLTDGLPPEDRRVEYHLLYSVLTHHIDLMRLLIGEIADVAAVFRRDSKRRVIDAAVQLQFAGGQIGSIMAGYRQYQARTSETMVIAGSHGEIIARDVTRSAELIGVDPDRREVVQPNHFLASDGFYDTIGEHVADFLFRVQHDHPLFVDAEDGKRALEIVEAAIRAANCGEHLNV